MRGFAPAGALLEFFVAAPDGSGFGEGRTFVVARNEGSADDLDARTGGYSGLVNGLNQGAESSTRLFRFDIPVNPAQQAALTGSAIVVTATATLAGLGTSEFSGNAPMGAGPLPVELTAFEVKAARDDARLSWRTATEQNNDHFDVERSLTGATFVKIGQVAGQGSKATPTDYAFTDAGIGRQVSGPVYYRLRQVDADGTASFSPVRTVSFAAPAALTAASLRLFPVPAGASTTLDLSALPAARTYRVALTDLSGRAVSRQTLAGGREHRLVLTGMASGSYLVDISGTDAQGAPLHFVKRLTKE